MLMGNSGGPKKKKMLATIAMVSSGVCAMMVFDLRHTVEIHTSKQCT